MKNIFEKTIQIIREYEESKATIRSIFYSKVSDIKDVNERRIIFHYIMEILRRKNSIDYILMKLTRGKLPLLNAEIRNSLRLLTFLMKWESFPNKTEREKTIAHFYQYLKEKEIYDDASKYIDKIKSFNISRAIKKLSPTKQLEITYHYPEWLISELLKVMPFEEVKKVLEVTTRKKVTWLRINTLKVDDIDSELRHLREEGILVKQDKYPIILKVEKAKNPVVLTNSFKKGHITVQDKASVLTVIALGPKPREIIWDTCAAPAMKTTLLAQLMKNEGVIIATDYSIKRSKKAIENIELLGAQNINWFIANAETFSAKLDFDKVLIDAPCSSTGVFQADPEFKWRITPNRLNSLIKLQRKLLKGILNNLISDSIVVYSTCSLLPQEGEEQILWLKSIYKERIELIAPNIEGREGYSKYKEIKEYVRRTFPHIHRTKGFFISKFIFKPK
ncbi:MAG: RsmB/NOP family class I SAM-dependent RNA methyltransferase [Candidatus Asgardarchaeia archaeon]